MPKTTTATKDSAKADEPFGTLVEEISNKLQAGQRVDLDAYIAANPAQADRLRRLLPMMEALAALGETAAGNSSMPGVADRSSAPQRGVIGDYRIIREIGRGGMGIVYEAEQVSLARRVALKVLPFVGVLDQRQLARFRTEAQAAAQLHHTNIVPVFAVGCDSGVHYYAMQYVDGQTLTQVIRELRRLAGLENEDLIRPSEQLSQIAGSLGGGRSGSAAAEFIELSSAPVAPPSVSPTLSTLSTDGSATSQAFFHSVAKIGIQVAEALEHAHLKGVIHRDVKPSNLILDTAGSLWITDFGLASFHQSSDLTLTMEGDLVGTLRYMSPEQALAKRVPVDHRTDIYSLGVTLYELLTLHPAIEGDDRQELLRQIAEQQPLPLRKRNGKLPLDLETIIQKAMAKEPHDRYATAQELADDLHRYLDDRPILAKRPGPVVRARKWIKRHKALTGTALAAVLLSVIIFAGIRIHRDRQLRDVAVAVGESLAGAQAAMEANDYALARQKLAQAEGRITDSRGALPKLAADIDQRKRDLDRFQEFIRLADEADNNIGGRAAQVRLATEALAHYGVLDDARWTAGLERSSLGAVHRARIRNTAYETLLLLADCIRGRQSDPRAKGDDAANKQLAARECMSYLTKAAAFHQQTTALLWLRSQAWRLLGDNLAADHDAELAKATEPAIALDHFIPAQDAASTGDMTEALRHLREALRLEPTHYWSLFMTGYYLHKLGRYNEALVAFTGCAAMRPKHAMAYSNRAAAHFHLDQINEAFADANRAIVLDPKDAMAYCNRANAYTKLGENRKALEDYDKSVELDPKGSLTYINRASTYDELRQYDRAIEDLDKAIELDPRSADAYVNRARAYWASQRYEQAIADATKALELDPKGAHAHNIRGSSYRKTGQTDRALADLRRAAELDPKLAEAQLNLGILYIENMGDANKALTHYQKALEINRHLMPAYFGCANAHEHLGQNEEAIADLTKAIELDAHSADAFVNRARMYGLTQRWEQAIADATKALELNPKSALAHNIRGLSYGNSGQRDRALADWQRALELDPNCLEAHVNLGSVYMRDMGDAKKALTHFDEVLRINPRMIGAYVKRADAHTRLGQYREAVADLTKAIESNPKDLRPFVPAHDGVWMFASNNPEPANALAWILATGPAEVRDPQKALLWAQKAIQASPNNWACLNTLGVVYYRLGRHQGSIETLQKSIQANKDGGFAADFLFLAMAHHKLGHAEEAKQNYAKAIDWLKSHGPKMDKAMAAEMETYRQEAEQVLKEN